MMSEILLLCVRSARARRVLRYLLGGMPVGKHVGEMGGYGLVCSVSPLFGYTFLVIPDDMTKLEVAVELRER